MILCSFLLVINFGVALNNQKSLTPFTTKHPKGPVHMESQVPSPTHFSKSQLSSLEKPLKHGTYSLKSDFDYFIGKNLGTC